MKNLVTFLDAAQRTIIGEQTDETASTISIQNPVVVNIVPQHNSNNQPSGMALQLLPVYFREFQGVKKNPTIFTYQKSQITTVYFEGGFDFRLYGQYDNIFNPPEAHIDNTAPAIPTSNAGPQVQTPAPVLKLFEEEK